MSTPITIAYGDGIGPEIMNAVLFILKEAGARIAPETIEIGKAVYERGVPGGIEDHSWESLRRTKIFLKSPITTPQGGGVKSLNVTVRKTLGLYANVRPCAAYAPFVETRHPKMDVVIVRENEEDLYAGIEYRQSHEVYHSIKLASNPGTERIIRYAFEYAKQNNRKKVTCLTKDNILKLTDGLFHKMYDQIGTEYPGIEKEHLIIDIGTARLADAPEKFDVVVTTNLYGDIVSDVVAEIAGSVGLAGSANLGEQCSMFEAIHGSAPDIAGKDLANPSGLLLAAVMMLVHMGQGDVAAAIHNAWLRTIEDGIHTGDIASENHTKERVGTQGFSKAVVARLGSAPTTLKAVSYPVGSGATFEPPARRKSSEKKDLVGADFFVVDADRSVEQLGEFLSKVSAQILPLKMISNRGVKVWPGGAPETLQVDQYRCRFLSEKPIPHSTLIDLYTALSKAGADVAKMETLCAFDGVNGFSAVQGA